MVISRLTEPLDIALRQWLPRQRWYGDKSRSLAEVAVDPLLTVEIDAGSVTVMLVACDFADETRSVYFAPVLWGEPESDNAPERLPRDAFAEPEFLGWLYSGFADSRIADVANGRRLSWIAGGVTNSATIATGRTQVLRGEQSNTSVRFDNEAILKVFRKVEPGINPDPEILRFLSTHSGFQHAPADLGTIELRQGTSSEPLVIGAMQAFVPNSRDAWAWLLEHLRILDEATIGSLLTEIALLGKRTADLHLALAAPSNNPAFSVEPITAGVREHLHRRIDAECRRTLDAVRVLGLRSAEELLLLERRLTEQLVADEALEGLGLSRVHGDFHLGQVLRADDDFVIIDFEGEPSRPVRERREKSSPLKDVAGMIRSLEYALATVTAENPDPRLRERLDRFGPLAKQAFTETYRESLSAAPTRLVPDGRDRFAKALSLFLIEKALYEVRYELDNRPDWVEIPLAALSALAAG